MTWCAIHRTAENLARASGTGDCERTLGGCVDGGCGGDSGDIGDEEDEVSAKGRGEHLGTEGCWRDDFGETLGPTRSNSSRFPRSQASWIVYRLYGEHRYNRW